PGDPILPPKTNWVACGRRRKKKVEVTMQSRWSDADAQDFVKRYAKAGVNADLAIRTYTTRLLGSDPRLVLHGGGNTSVKTTAKDMLGQDVDVLCVKGSGWDMGNIEPAGLPAVRLAELRRLRALDKLSDEDMVNFQRINLLDSSAPNPSARRWCARSMATASPMCPTRSPASRWRNRSPMCSTAIPGSKAWCCCST